MDAVSLPLMDSRAPQTRTFRIFTTKRSKEAILRPETATPTFTLDVAK